MSESRTYTPAAYWHRLDDEILEPKQTTTVERPEPKAPKVPQYQRDPVYRERVKAASRRQYERQKQARQPRPARNRDWRGVPFPEAR